MTAMTTTLRTIHPEPVAGYQDTFPRFTLADRQRLITEGWQILEIDGASLAEQLLAGDRFQYIAYQYEDQHSGPTGYKAAFSALRDEYHDYASPQFLARLAALCPNQGAKAMRRFMTEPAYSGELAVHPEHPLFAASRKAAFPAQLELLACERAEVQRLAPDATLVLGNAATIALVVRRYNRQQPRAARLLGEQHDFAFVRSTTQLSVPGRDQRGDPIEVAVQLMVGAVSPHRGITVDSISPLARRQDIGILPLAIPGRRHVNGRADDVSVWAPASDAPSSR